MFNRILQITILLTVTTFPLATAASDVTRQFSSGEKQVQLVELFTSEGCSSCPPADRWLSTLIDKDRLWKEFVPVAFHVDYWDYIGWKDPFAQASYSDRQRRYAQEGGVNTVYTPGMFLNGKEWRDWYWGRSPVKNGSHVGVLTLQLDGEVASIAFDAKNPTGDLRVYVALLGTGLESDVSAGENSGKVLRHDFVVLNMSSQPLSQSANVYTSRLAVPRSNIESEQRAIVAWIASANRQAPIQAVGGFM